MASSSSPNTGGRDMIARRVKGGWTKEEDDVLRKLVAAHGTTSWSLVSRSVPGRSNKACRLRWCNQISPDVEHRPFTAGEDKVVVDAQRVLGNRWADIARLLPGRTENSVKNRWHCSLKRKFSPPDHGEAPKMIMPIQVRMSLPLQACSPKRKFDSEVAGDANVTSGPTISDPMTILSLALPGHGSLPGDHGADVPDQTNRPPVEPPTTSPVEGKMSLMEDKMQELSQETRAMRKPMVLCELQQNPSVKIFGVTLYQEKIGY